MKTYALMAVGMLASYPLVALTQNNEQEAVALSAAQMDGVTAGMFQLPKPLASISALANATGRGAMTGTSTTAIVRGNNTPVQFGHGTNWVIASGAVASASGDGSRSTSSSSSDDTNGTTPFGRQINRTMTVGPTQVTVYSSVQPTGLLTYNLMQLTGGSFFHH
jgi:hypothetical protein